MTTFSDLKIGQRFKFFAGGSLLTKTDRRGYENPAFHQSGLSVDDLDQTVIPANNSPTPTSDEATAKGRSS